MAEASSDYPGHEQHEKMLEVGRKEAIMKFCTSCGQPVQLVVPPGDDRERHVCQVCAVVHYQNPRLVVGCLAHDDAGRILLCRRAIEPQYGLWTLPAGFMENGESVEEGALRETREEANASLANPVLYCMVSIPYVNQVFVIFRGLLADPGYYPGRESLETALFGEKEIPWDKLAFRTVTFTLQRFFEDNRTGSFGVHVASLHKQERS
jgi:ADP-ribose pyrophosphatase YjhB (NUDIX family)